MNWVSAALHRLAGSAGTEPALLTAEQAVSFKEFEQRTDRVAGGLMQYGVAEGCLVPIAVTSRVDMLTVAVAMLRLGATPLPLDPKCPPAALDGLLKLCAATLLVVDHPTSGRSGIEEVRAEDVTEPPGIPRWRRQRAPTWWKAIVTPAGDSEDVVLTAGSLPTEAPKATALRVAEGGRALIVGPLSQNGPFELALRHLFRGGAVICPDRFSPAAVGSLAQRWAPTWALMAPTHLHRILHDSEGPAICETLRRSLKTLVHSSAPCDPALKAALIGQIGADRVCEYYGTSYYDGTFATAAEWARHNETVGRSIPTGDLRVVDDDGAELGPGMEGTIQGRSRIGMAVRSLRDASDTVAGGWLSVGDRGVINRNGYLYLSGGPAHRAISGGTNIDVREIEAVLRRHADVQDAEVRGQDDPEWGQRVAATVWVKDPALTAGQIEAYCRRSLAPHKVPKSWTVQTEPRRLAT